MRRMFALLVGLSLLLPQSVVLAEDVPVESVSLQQMLEALILRDGIEIMENNIKAAERESGDIDKAIRATLGISIRDIKKYGLLGGPNSEMRKLFTALGLVKRIEG